MLFAVDVRQGKIRRVKRTQRLALVGAQAEIPGGECSVMRYRLAHKPGERGQVKPALAGVLMQELLFLCLGKRKAQHVTTDALRLHFKARGASEIGSSDPELVCIFPR